MTVMEVADGMLVQCLGCCQGSGLDTDGSGGITLTEVVAVMTVIKVVAVMLRQLQG
jgi:hypothetical protein